MDKNDLDVVSEKKEDINVEGFTNEIPILTFEDGKIPFENKRYTITSEITIQELMGDSKPEEDPYLVLIVDGGVGDNICSTPMIKSAKKHFPNKKIIVGASHAEILEGNPDCDALYHLGSPGDMYEKYVKRLKHFGSVIKRDIYNAAAHKLSPLPLSGIFCHLYGVPFENDDIKVYLSEREIEEAKKFLSSFPREVILIHPSGGRLVWNGNQITPNKDWYTEYWAVLVQELVKDFDVIQMGGKEEEPIPNVTTYLMGQTSIRQSAALASVCLTFISIDSFLGHVGPAVGKRGVVLFGRSNPYIAGHAKNRNLFVKNSCWDNNMHCGRPMGYFGDSEMFRGVRRPWVCPDRTCMKAITPVLVYDETINLIKMLKNGK